ncbi:MAG: hypothetical protein HC902_06835 [Calothrix sp. SM1_5_4]|nr:hypothetical protein [Calothrix sp. SM1_5_4]
MPALEWSEGEILGDLRKRHRKTFRTAADPLKRTLRELARLNAQPRVRREDL